MMNYKQFYDRISGPLRPYAKVLGGLNKAITRTFYLLFPYISYFGLAEALAGLFFLRQCLFMGEGFFLLSLGRSLYNRPRLIRPGTFSLLLKRIVLASHFLAVMFFQQRPLPCLPYCLIRG